MKKPLNMTWKLVPAGDTVRGGKTRILVMQWTAEGQEKKFKGPVLAVDNTEAAPSPCVARAKGKVTVRRAVTVLAGAVGALLTVATADGEEATPFLTATPVPSENVKNEGPDTGEEWSIHFQGTAVFQAYPGFPASFDGPNSLPRGGEGRETISATAFLGRKLPWEGGELYINPEINQGFGLDRTFGLAGFSNGEAQKAGFDTPKPNVARLFVRQTFGLGGEQETLDPDLNQLGERVDISRITVTAGKFAISDIFDDNQYAHDPRTTFLNWSLWEGAAWDYPADQKGYTDGAAVEFNQKDWTLRGGWFLEPKIANNRDLDPRIFKRYGTAAELETRHTWWGEAGTIRVLGFLNRAPMGNLNEALALAAQTGATPDSALATVRHDSWKAGFVLNFEQALTSDLGAFSRLSWNDGHTETWAFADIDQSVTLGLSLKGTSWSRADDTIGLATAVNGLSKAHRNFFAAGGTGLLIGDGQLNYAPESIIEAYYSASVTHDVALTLDYQFIANPAYNQDRGPVSIFAARAHVQF